MGGSVTGAGDVLAFVRTALPAPPARVLEVGAGQGELAAALDGAGYEVVAIDPAAAPDRRVRPVALLDLEEREGSFDAAVAVLSLHHVEPLEPSLAHLAALVRPGGSLVVDEFDVALFDAVAAAWWGARRRELGQEAPEHPAETAAELRAHLHPVERIRAVLAPAFELSPVERGPYLHRWELGPALLPAEEEAIAAGRLPAVGVRFTGVRR